MRKAIIFVLFILSLNGYSQKLDSIKVGDISMYGYITLNNIYHPGVRFGVDAVIRTREINTKTEELLLDFNIGMMYHEDRYTGYFASVGAVKKWTSTKDNVIYIGASPLGYFKSYYSEKLYELKDDNTFNIVDNASIGYFAPAVSVGTSLQISEQTSCIFQGYSYFLMPYNSYIMPLFFVEFGFRTKILDK